MPIPPRVSVVALRTADLARSTAFYVGLGWELSPVSTAAMSLFKTAGSLLLVCTDELLAELGGQEVAAALAGEPTGEAVLSIHVASDAEVDAALQEAAGASGRVVKGAAPTPLGGSYGFFADPDGHVWEVIHHPLYQLGSDGRPEVPRPGRRAARGWGGWRRPPCTGPGQLPGPAGQPPAPPDRPALRCQRISR
jgi:catechol 2,3-dioxygenase-like lactoylglutathione lyase family enzyme